MSLDANSILEAKPLELDSFDPMQGLTTRMYQFVQASFSGLTDTEAYRKVYDCSGMTDKTIGRKAADVARLPIVRAKLRQMREGADAHATLVPSLGRNWILERIMSIADYGDRDSTRLAALVSLGKVAGIDLFRETTRIERVERTPEDIDAELRARLGELAKTIDGSASSVPADQPPTRKRQRSR